MNVLSFKRTVFMRNGDVDACDGLAHRESVHTGANNVDWM